MDVWSNQSGVVAAAALCGVFEAVRDTAAEMQHFPGRAMGHFVVRVRCCERPTASATEYHPEYTPFLGSTKC